MIAYGLEVLQNKTTYIPAFLAAATPEGASSNTRIFCESIGPPCSKSIMPFTLPLSV